MPRLYSEAPLASIWEGSGNVQCLDALRAMVKSPASVEAFFAEVMEGAGAEPKLDAYVSSLRDEIPGDIETIESRARRIVEGMAVALQASLLVRYGDPAVADAFCASRLSGDWGNAFGTLPAGTDFSSHHRAPPAARLRDPVCEARAAGGSSPGRFAGVPGEEPPAAHDEVWSLSARPTCSAVITPREAAVGVNRHQRAEAAQGAVGEQ